jgi:hypothetical protein
MNDFETIPVILVKSNQEKLHFKSTKAAGYFLGKGNAAICNALKRGGRTKHRTTKEYYYVIKDNQA